LSKFLPWIKDSLILICDKVHQLVFAEIVDRKGKTTKVTEGTHLLKNTDIKNAANATDLLENDNEKIVIKKSYISNLHAFTVSLALSVHSIFEGLALGLEDGTSQVRTYVLYF